MVLKYVSKKKETVKLNQKFSVDNITGTMGFTVT